MTASTLKTLEVVYSPEAITRRVEEIAAEINTLYQGESLVMVCILKGAFMFFSDLVKHVTVRPELDFVRVASYGNARESSRAVSFTKDVELSLKDKHVLLVEDVVDSGHTMLFLRNQMQARGARSLRVAALVDKYERREVDVAVDFVGFALPKGFIVGYGLDYAERFRELPAIYKAVLE